MRRLLIRPGAIGDCILALPAMESLRAEYTEVWTPTSVVPLIRFADRVRPITSTRLDLLGLPGYDPPEALIDAIRAFDSIVSWYGANRPPLRECVQALDLPFRFFPALPPDDEAGHVIDYFLRQAGFPPGAIPKIACTASPGEMIVLHPFSGSAKKNWPLAEFRELARRIEAPVEWCAGPEDRLDGALRIANLFELGCRLATASVYVGNDSGITHLAAAVGAPVVALFGPTDPARWAPRGQQVRVVKADMMEQIEVEEVLDAVRSLL